MPEVVSQSGIMGVVPGYEGAHMLNTGGTDGFEFNGAKMTKRELEDLKATVRLYDSFRKQDIQMANLDGVAHDALLAGTIDHRTHKQLCDMDGKPLSIRQAIIKQVVDATYGSDSEYAQVANNAINQRVAQEQQQAKVSAAINKYNRAWFAEQRFGTLEEFIESELKK